MDEEPPYGELSPPPLWEVARSPHRRPLEERGLVILSMGLPYWIVREEGAYHLLVRAGDHAAVERELALYEQERVKTPRKRTLPPPPRLRTTSLFVYGWCMAVFFLLQLHYPESEWLDKGSARSDAILNGEWWRVVTALTLHADLGHLLANLTVGILFAIGLLPWLGTGWTWFGILLSGALGNALNAWGYRGEFHNSIGASTAVFGALGMLVGWQIAHPVAAAHLRQQRIRRFLFPVASGLALLAYLGVGDGTTSRIDITAHLWGMVSGIVIGLFLGWSRLPDKTSPFWQRILMGVSIAILILGWKLART